MAGWKLKWDGLPSSHKKYLEVRPKLGDEIAYWEMSDYINLPIRKYSLGMKQRLVIAMYFLSQAKCWLMDEITNGLDEYYRQKFFDRLAQIDRKEQLVLLSSHYKEELVEICDSMVTIHQGKIEEVPL